ncbi:MAG: OmpA family protein [Bacillota bacterium]
MEGKRIKWGNIIIFLLIIAAAASAVYYKYPGSFKNVFNSDSSQNVSQQKNDNLNNKVDNKAGSKDGRLPSPEESFVMGLDSWIGGTPVLIGLNREYNRDYSLSLKVEYIPNDNDRIEALKEGRIHATEMSLPSFIRFQEKYPDTGVIIGITDFSRGADGIIAKSEIKDLNDMEDRNISYVGDGTGKFILNKFLRLIGLRYQDIKPIERDDMGEVIDDLKSGRADLIVSWSPDMNLAVKEINASKPGSVKVLITTKEVPDLVPTMLVVNKSVAEKYPDKVDGFLRTWYASSKYIIERPDKAYDKLAELMNENGEYGEVSGGDVEASFKDIKLMSLNDNLRYFGLEGDKEKVGTIIDDTVETWKRYGDLSIDFNPSKTIYTGSFLAKLRDDKELLTGVLDSELTGNAGQNSESKKEFKKQDEVSIEKNTERVAKVDIPPVYYDSGKATVKAESIPVLSEVLGILLQFPDYYLIVDAHTDSVGSEDMNLKLSKDRALQVKEYLVMQGIDQNRIVARGWGEYRPIIANETTDEDKAKNRRTEFILTREVDGK